MENSVHQCIHELFEAQAATTPGALALVSGDIRLTYGELNARANRLAAELRRRGAGPETLVAICMHRNERMVVAMLAILKTGAAYVPLDPAYPRERMEFILSDSAAPLLVAEPAAGLLSMAEGAVRIDFDPASEAALPASPESLPSAGAPENLAYIIYTSGSTGRPKGVPIEHRNTVALIQWAWSVYQREEIAGVLAATSICFDLSVFELFVPLTRGGAVILSENALALPEISARKDVTLINTVPSAIRELVHSGGVPDSVRVVNLAGEPLTAALADEIYAKTKVQKVYDLYGPSETTTYSTFALRTQGGPAIIGKPITGTEIYLLDETGKPVVPTAAGEIYIGGAGVARGYLNRPDLTAERFVPSPFGEGPLYKTGDLARWRTDGDLEFIGRVDFQLKVRGYRIEPGEIEAALRECAGVRDVVVVGRDDVNGEKRLAAYIAGQESPETTTRLRNHLRAKLPEYMTPAAFVWLEALPLTANGKVDRNALPEPEWGAVDERAEFIAPRNDIERAVTKAWESVLGINPVGALDNFFELGGHSLMAIRVVSKLRAEPGVELPLRSLFEHRTVESLAAHIETMRKGELPQEILPPIEPAQERSSSANIPASFAQQRLWFLDQLSPGSAAYNIPEGYRLTGSLNIGALEFALGEIVRRHEAVRTVFGYENEHPVQIIRPVPEHGSWNLEIEDISSQDKTARQTATARIAREEAFAPFDLQRGPLMRTRLLKLGAEEHVLLLTIHHIVSDGWSMGVLARELAALYDAGVRGLPNPLNALPALPVQYTDFAQWQRKRLAGARLAKQIEYWKSELAAMPAALEIPASRPPTIQRSRVAREYRFAFPAALTQQLHGLSRECGATLFMTLLAAFETLLHRLTAREDFIIGTALAGRNNAETEGLIGFFVNTLPVRARMAGALTFQQHLASVREGVLGMLAHQDLPFERLVEEINPGRNATDSPLFSIMFTMDDGLDATTELHGLKTSRLPAGETVAKFDLTLTMAEIDGRIEGWFVYDTDKLCEADAARMAGQLERLAESAAANPASRLATLPFISAGERQLLCEWNATTSEFPVHRTVNALFAEQAAQNADAIAIRSGEASMSYRELDRRANGLAARLRELGCVDGSRVVVCMERSQSFIVAMLAVLKAGGAYVPIEPPAPAERLAMILEDASASMIVTEKRHAHTFAQSPAHQVLIIDEETIADASAPPPTSTNGESAAYIIYTSGSTGRPKGSIIPHRAISRLVLNTDYVQLRPDDVIAQAATCEFDAATFEIWGALLNGARVAIVEKPALLSAHSLAARIEREGITTLFLTTALFNHLVLENPSVFRRLRHVLFGGEACDPARVRPVLAANPPERLLHVYGPTETTTFATWHHVTDVPEAAATIPIGRPIANTLAYIIDESGEPVGVGVAGEIAIGGPGVALGYLNRPELTAEKFVEHRLGGRFYKTGDLARWNANGAIEFIGRVDFQLKIRGYRIEPGEIEAVLRDLSQVRESLVLGREDSTGEKRLVAYFVADGNALDATAVRVYLRAKLPEFMVPTAFVRLDAMPLTPNGKVDRNALPAPDWSAAALGRPEYIAPRNDVERAVCKSWEAVLRVEAVGALDNFFDLGGHSLLAIRVVSRLREELRIDLPLRALFENQSVESLASYIEMLHSESGAATALPGIERALPDRSAGGKAPLSFAQQRLWFLDQLTPGSSAYNIPEGFRLNGRLDSVALESALAEIVRRHESLRTVFAYESESPVQIIHGAAEQGGWKLAIEDLSPLAEPAKQDAIKRIAREEAFALFDLQVGPLMRTRLLRLDGEEHVLLLTIHHIVADGWSMGVMARELSALYGAFSRGADNPLDPLPVQYPDFAMWQRQSLTGARLQTQLEYWKTQLAGDLAPLALPTDFPRPEDLSDRAGESSLVLSTELSARLKSLCQEQRVTLFMLLLAAFDVLLHRLSGNDDILIGSPAAGRNRVEIEGLIGFFVNTLVLRTNLAGDPTFRELLGRVREVTLGAFEHQDIPFEKLVEELNPERRLGHTPFFQVMLNLINVAADPPALDGFSVESIPFEQFQSKFDLTLYVSDESENLGLKAVYNASLFTPARIAGLLAQMQALLEQAAENPAVPISTLSLLTEKSALPDPTATIDAGESQSILARLGHFAAQTPEKNALTGPGGEWSYKELDEFTTRAAHWLQACGLQREDVVAIWAARDSSLAAAMLAVWKAGGAFVILDPAYPEARFLKCIRIAKPKAWIECAQSPALPAALESEAAASLCRARLPVAESAASAFNNVPDGDLPTPLPDGLAYIAFTSGTTGHPKAIAGEHRPLSHFLAWHGAKFGLSAESRFSVLSGLGHDPLLRDIMAPLYVGATACFPQADAFDRPDLLRAWLREEEITAAHITPAMATLITTSLATGALLALRNVFLGGELLNEELVRQISAAVPNARIVNFYGATETPQAMAWYEVSRNTETPGYPRGIPIGRGIDGVQMLLLTKSGKIAGIGEPGEICVRTPFLARGYFQDTAATAASFVVNPFTNRPGDRIYKTGDIGICRTDGEIEYLGRNDRQIKIRGYRIEPAEIESELRRHPAVRDAAVLCERLQTGENGLVAYIVADAFDAGEMREFLKAKLPDFMTPALFVRLDALPLTPGGKLDRKALPSPEAAGAVTADVFIAPRDDLELRLVRIWEDVLRVRGIGVRDDFFDLGGHSLLGVILLARIERGFSKRLPLSAIFEARTVERLSAVLRHEGWVSSWYSLVPIQPCGSRAPLFGIHDLHYKDLAARLGADQPIYGLRYGLAAHTRDGVAVLPARIEDLAAHYIQEMRALQPEGPYRLMGLSFGGVVAFEMAQQLAVQRQEVSLLALFDSYLVATEHRLPPAKILSNLVTLGPGALMGRLKQRAARIQARFRKAGYQPHLHHPWGVQRDLADAYQPRIYPGRVVLFKATDPLPTVFHAFDPPEVGWRRWAANGCEIHAVAGGHIDMLDEPHVGEISEIIARLLP
jgi:amino acid adenylation domain-containing protein